MTEPIEVSKTHMITDGELNVAFIATIIQPGYVTIIQPGYATFQQRSDSKQTALKLEVQVGKEISTFTFPSVDSLNKFIKHLSRISEMMMDEDVDYRIRNKQ